MIWRSSEKSNQMIIPARCKQMVSEERSWDQIKRRTTPASSRWKGSGWISKRKKIPWWSSLRMQPESSWCFSNVLCVNVLSGQWDTLWRRISSRSRSSSWKISYHRTSLSGKAWKSRTKGKRSFSKSWASHSTQPSRMRSWSENWKMNSKATKKACRSSKAFSRPKRINWMSFSTKWKRWSSIRMSTLKNWSRFSCNRIKRLKNWKLRKPTRRIGWRWPIMILKRRNWSSKGRSNKKWNSKINRWPKLKSSIQKLKFMNYKTRRLAVRKSEAYIKPNLKKCLASARIWCKRTNSSRCRSSSARMRWSRRRTSWLTTRSARLRRPPRVNMASEQPWTKEISSWRSNSAQIWT